MTTKPDWLDSADDKSFLHRRKVAMSLEAIGTYVLTKKHAPWIQWEARPYEDPMLRMELDGQIYILKPEVQASE